VPNVAQHVAKDLGYYEEACIKFEGYWLEPGTHAHAAVAGNIDIALMSPTALAMAIEAGNPIKAIGLIAYGEPWHNAGVIVALNNSGIKTVEDLRGKRIAVSYPGDVDHIYLLEVLRKYGIEDEVEIVFMLWPMHVGALVGGDVDAVQMIPYYTAVMDLEGIDYVVLEKPKGISVWKDVAVLAASTDTIENRWKELKKFLEVYYKTQEYLQKNPDIHAEYLVKYAGWKPEVAELLAEKGEIISLAPDGRFNKTSMRELLKLMVDFGFLNEEMPLDRYLTEELLPG
jgi:ABC-type nitrate/sulfonate/bicarbonate transport system substrate-binding protein